MHIPKRTGNEIPAFIRRRCPGASEEELQEAYERFQEYLALAYQIWEREQAEGETRPPEEPAPNDDKLGR